MFAASEIRATDIDLKSDTWTATDALGRKLPGYKECGPPRDGKFVGIFYFLWAGQGGTEGPYDISKLQAASPTPYDPFSLTYGGNPAVAGTWHHWGEPELGYYVMPDTYVIGKHAAMLADAGVDTLIFDASNTYLYTTVYTSIVNTFAQMRSQGYKTPQLCFLIRDDVHPGTTTTALTQLYNEFYSQNIHPELWFQWQGKPLVLACPTTDPVTTSTFSPAINNFFTIRYSWAWTDKRSGFHSADWAMPKNASNQRVLNMQDKWAWIDDLPQNFGWHGDSAKPEEVSVSIAQHPDDLSYIGRSCSVDLSQNPPVVTQPSLADAHPEKGTYFAQQWDQALKIDPAFLYITSWNEWIAQRQVCTVIDRGNPKMLNVTVPVGKSYFVDSFDQEFSRDAEPMNGGHTDNYYYQLVAGIRKFKGVRPDVVVTDSHTIDMNGDMSDWAGVSAEYLDRSGDAVQRNETLWGSAGHLTNTSGRNDFTNLKVAHDASSLYFYAQTKDPITPNTGAGWMQLFIDSDDTSSTGWEGYDFMVNRTSPGASTATLERSTGGWNWVKVADVPYKVIGNKLQLQISRADLGLPNHFTINFHWADNVWPADATKLGDIVQFSLNGDGAPDRRFNYRYQGVMPNAATMGSHYD